MIDKEKKEISQLRHNNIHYRKRYFCLFLLILAQEREVTLKAIKVNQICQYIRSYTKTVCKRRKEKLVSKKNISLQSLYL